MREYKINAENQPLGRLASKIALLLQGKDTPAYEPRLSGDVKVIVYNASKIKFTGKKFYQKVYRYHTGYLGHLRTKTLRQLFEKNPAEVLKRAVKGMLPKNKLRPKRLKNLIIYNQEIKE